VLDRAALDELCDLALRHSLTYTVHLAMDVALGASDEELRRRSVAQLRRQIQVLTPLEVPCFAVHFDRSRELENGTASLEEWQGQLRRSAGELSEVVAPRRLCVETLAYPYQEVEPVVRECGLSICLDIGHLLLYGFDLDAHLDRYLLAARVIHLHGIRDGKDHRDLGGLDPELLQRLLTRFAERGKELVVTIEVFREKDLVESLRVLEGHLA
jgi:sugar phosphate isomerase/epimerase